MGDHAKDIVSAGLLVGSFAFPPLAIVATGVRYAWDSFDAPRLGLGEHQGAQLQLAISNQATAPVVYGQARVGLSLADARKHPSDPDVLYVVGVISVGSEDGSGIEDVTAIIFDDDVDNPAIVNPVTTGGAPSGVGVDAKYVGKLDYIIQLGTDAQTASAHLTGVFPTEWPATSDGRGIAYIVLRLLFDTDVYPNGLPNVTAVVQGQKVYDPRTTNTVYSTNPALCVLDWLMSTKYGFGASLADIDTQSFEDAANFCDENVNTTAYNGVRFTCNGVVDTSENRGAVLNALLSSCRGQVVYQGSTFRMIINQIETPTTFELTEDNIVGDWEFSRGGEVPNSVTASYVDPDANDQVREITWPEAGQTNNFLTADNGVGVHAMFDLPFTQNVFIAQQIGMVQLREAREDIVVALTAKESALILQVGEVVPLTHRTPGFTDKPFRVVTMVPQPDATVRLLLREYDDAAYSLDTQNTQDTGSGTDLPNALVCQPPSGLTLTSDDTVEIVVGGVRMTRIFVEWTAAPEPFLSHYEIRHRPTAETEWIFEPNVERSEVEAYTVPVNDTVQHTVEVRAVNTLGVPSVWVSDTTTPAMVFYEAEITSLDFRFVGDRLWAIVAADPDTRTSGGVSIIGTRGPGTPADPTLTGSAFDFSLSGARSGEIDTGLDVANPGANLTSEGRIRVRAINAGGDEGPVVAITYVRVGSTAPAATIDTFAVDGIVAGTDCVSPDSVDVDYAVTAAGTDEVTIERHIDGTFDSNIVSASTTHSDSLTDDLPWFQTPPDVSPIRGVEYRIVVRSSGGGPVLASQWSGSRVSTFGVQDCP